MLSILVFIIFFLSHLSLALDLMTEKQRFCNSETGEITAASSSFRDDGSMFLFVGVSFFLFYPENQSLTDVYLLKNEFKEEPRTVDAVAASIRTFNFNNLLVAASSNNVYIYANETYRMIPNFSFNLSKEEFAKHDRIESVLKPSCYALQCYPHPEECHIWLVHNKPNFGSMKCVIFNDNHLHQCEKKEFGIQSPKYLLHDLEIKSSCKAFAINADHVTETSTILYVDTNQIHYYRNDEKVYSVSVDKIFGCQSSVKIVFVVGTLIGLLVFLSCTLTVVIVCVSKARHWNLRDTTNTLSLTGTVSKQTTKKSPLKTKLNVDKIR